VAETAAKTVPLGHRGWYAARAEILDAFARGERLVVLLGPPGVGKTFLLNDLEHEFRWMGGEVQRVDCGDLLSDKETEQVLLVDEADRIDPTALQCLVARASGFAVLAALPSFSARLDGVPHRPVTLGPLEAEEVPAYVTARLSAMGTSPERFTREALQALGEASAGVPRLLNILIGTSLFVADMNDDARITDEHVHNTAAMRVSMEPPSEADSADDSTGVPRALAVEPSSLAALPAAELPALELAGAVGAQPHPPAAARRWPSAAFAASLVLALLGAAWLGVDRQQNASSPSTSSPHAGDAQARPAVQETEGPIRQTEAPMPAPSRESAPQSHPSTAQSDNDFGLSPEASVRVVLTYPRGDAQAADRGGSIATVLGGRGLIVGRPFPISGNADGPALRYFFLEDRDAAAAIGRLVGEELGAPQLGTIRNGAPLPRPGTIELALPATLADRPLPTRPEGVETPVQTNHSLLAAAQLLQPANGAVIAASRLPLEMLLTWSLPAEAAPGGSFVEVVALQPDQPDSAAKSSPEVFAGYADRDGAQLVPIAQAGAYTWRVLTVTRDGPRYRASPWSRFTVRSDG
jgi:hypothetical protein